MALFESTVHNLHFSFMRLYCTISSLSLCASWFFSYSFSDPSLPGLGGKTLTRNKGRKRESTGEETHYKRMGGEVVNRPQLPQHQGSPRRKRRGREPGPRRPVGRARIHYCHRWHSSPDSQGKQVVLRARGTQNTTDSIDLQSVLAVNGAVNDVGDGLWRCMHVYVCVCVVVGGGAVEPHTVEARSNELH